jgi:hypothetical protein
MTVLSAPSANFEAKCAQNGQKGRRTLFRNVSCIFLFSNIFFLKKVTVKEQRTSTFHKGTPRPGANLDNFLNINPRYHNYSVLLPTVLDHLKQFTVSS